MTTEAVAGGIFSQIYVDLACAALVVAILSVGLWRMLPRRAYALQWSRTHAEGGALQERIAEPGEAEDQAAEFEREIEARIQARTAELKVSNRALGREITDEHCATEDKRLLGELLMRTNTGTVLFDKETTVLRCNEALARLLGRDDGERLKGCELWKLLGFKDDSELRHFFHETFRLGALAREFDAMPAARGSIWIEASGVALVLHGRPCIMALLRDVSERIAAERMLRERFEALSTELDVARQATAGKAEFLAKVNHELRTPLNGIIGLSEMLRHAASARSLPGSEIRKFCNTIHQSGTYLLSLVDDLIDLSRLSAGSWSLSPVGVAVRTEIDAALLTLGSTAGQKRIFIENTCPANIEWVLDQRAFKQIVINLVSNAVKFSPPDSRVRVAISRSANAMALHVSDHGPGISPEDRDRILIPFGRGRYAQEHNFDGVGLGLCIVSELLKLHGGTLAIDSKIGGGSTFTAQFPVGPRQPIPMQVAAE